jgi:hypothetical protein
MGQPAPKIQFLESQDFAQDDEQALTGRRWRVRFGPLLILAVSLMLWAAIIWVIVDLR